MRSIARWEHLRSKCDSVRLPCNRTIGAKFVEQILRLSAIVAQSRARGVLLAKRDSAPSKVAR
ncbi:MAG: hypothetical protein CVT47_00645 [Thermoplasmata archaeon HGW-Thermoplasmata-2]|nr:MAG: hypothetical protein CVT47_00645 [Thermoplasmata archaeon HGW-Thermoplasmata-2]